MNLLQLQPRHRLLTWLALLLLVALVSYGQVAAQPAAPELVAGSYAGTVNVMEPAPLGALDLLLEITNANGALSGQVNAIKTQVFLGGPTFTGSVTASQGVTTTVRIESQTFSGTVSGRTVQRRFVLTGDVLDGGETLRGVYTETIVGFKPQPMLVKGAFLLVRPSGVTEIITVPTPRGSTPVPTPTTPGSGGVPTPTATATTPPVNGNGPKLFLPLVQRGASVNAAAVEEAITDSAPTVAPTATPTPTAIEMSLPTATETPTPTPLVLGASTVLTTTTEMQQQIHLPLIIQ
ncbi:MAG: hypothetical protein DYG89_45050 [Caldilinea sp. CFX5]|nr:hypothetical protein [Caldilinea sp. CFX5]